jgi:hypothetical protein
VDRLKILIVCRDFFPIISPRSFRSTELAKEFSRQGQTVNVLTIFRKDGYKDFIRENPEIQISMMPPLLFREIEVSGGHLSQLFKKVLRRLMVLLFEYPQIELMFKVSRCLKNVDDYDLMISVATPHPVHWGIASARKKGHMIARVWIADCGDPYMGDTNDSFRKPFYFKYLEKWFCRKADYLTIPRIEMKDNYYPEFHNKIIQIPQGVNFEDFNTAVYKRNDIPTFAFAGNFIRTTRNPSHFLDFLASLDFMFRFVIYAKNHDLVKPFVKRMESKLELHDFIPRKELVYELSKMDFLVNISFDRVHQSPSKLIDYTLAKRPILLLASDNVDPYLINDFLSGKYEKQFKPYNIEDFNIKTVAGKFLQLRQAN